MSIWSNATVAGIIGALAGAVFGSASAWFVARVEGKKQRRLARIDAISSQARELHALARGYWRSSGQDPAKESRMKELNDQLAIEIDSIETLGFLSRSREAQRVASEIYELTTGGNFESKKRVPDASRVERMKVAFRELQEALS